MLNGLCRTKGNFKKGAENLLLLMPWQTGKGLKEEIKRAIMRNDFGPLTSIIAACTLGFWKATATSGFAMILATTSSGVNPICSATTKCTQELDIHLASSIYMLESFWRNLKKATACYLSVLQLPPGTFSYKSIHHIMSRKPIPDSDLPHGKTNG